MSRPARTPAQLRTEEHERLAALRGYGILDTPNEAQFDALVQQAAREMGTPVAMISLIDEHRQWLKAKVGVAPDEIPRTISFCTHAIRGPDVFVVEDLAADHRFVDNPFVKGDPHVRFYAGAPLKTPEGKRIGTICVLDTAVHATPTTAEKQMLETLAALTMRAFERRRTE